MSIQHQFDLVILGGGIEGCSIAYHFLRANPNARVALIDRGRVCAQASSGAAGMLAAQVECDKDGPLLDLCLQSRALFPQLVKDLKIDVQYFADGMAQLAWTSEQQEKIESRLKWQRAKGLDCSWLTAQETAQKFPFLSAVQGAFFTPQDGQVTSALLSGAFAQNAKQLGAQFFENISGELLIENKKVVALQTAQGKFIADQFVLAAGSWSGQVLKEVPVYPVQGQVLTIDCGADWISRHHWTAPIYLGQAPASNIDCYAVPKPDGKILVGATSFEIGFDLSEDKKATQTMFSFIKDAVPQSKNFTLSKVWTGFRPATKDRLPILGFMPQIQNLIVASAHFRNGILLSPITGKIVTEMLNASSLSFDVEPFLPKRFL